MHQKQHKKCVLSWNTAACKCCQNLRCITLAHVKLDMIGQMNGVVTNTLDLLQRDKAVLPTSDKSIRCQEVQLICQRTVLFREYRFRVSGTRKEVRDWEISGDGAGYFDIMDYGLLRMDWEPAYVEPCVTATVTAVLEDGRKLTAAVRAYSEVNIYIDKLFADFERRYTTSSMTTKEKAEKAAWYISTTSDYELYNYNWIDIFLKGKGDCYASRYALQYLCNYMGIKAVACRNLDDHGKTLLYADGRFYVIVTGFNEPKPRPYGIYEISGGALEDLAEKNKFDLDYFQR